MFYIVFKKYIKKRGKMKDLKDFKELRFNITEGMKNMFYRTYFIKTNS